MQYLKKEDSLPILLSQNSRSPFGAKIKIKAVQVYMLYLLNFGVGYVLGFIFPIRKKAMNYSIKDIEKIKLELEERYATRIEKLKEKLEKEQNYSLELNKKYNKLLIEKELINSNSKEKKQKCEIELQEELSPKAKKLLAGILDK